jgi:peptidoglycan/xylan/chitin deacetylase (PgdA/CDA1 family)
MNFVENYWEIERGKPPGLRSKIRSFALDVLSATSGMKNNTEWLQKPRIQFLYIHHIFKDEEKALQDLIDELLKDHVFISYSEGVKRLIEGNIDKPYIVISSDDGLKNNVTAARILNANGISACFFICPAIVGEKNNERVAEFSKVRLDFPPVQFMDWNEVDQLMKMGHEIGGHTMNHVNLGKVSPEIAQTEISECKNILDRHCNNVSHFAFPYGRYSDFPTAHKDFVYGAGFESCATAERGCHISNGRIDPMELLIRRDHIILTWPMAHIRYFIVKNSQKADYSNNFYLK